MAQFFLNLLALVALSSSAVASGATLLNQAPPAAMPRQQLINIIDALIGAGDFNGWANALSGSDFLTIPLSATLFVPSDDLEGAPAAVADTSIIPYHIVPQLLTFSELSLLKPNSRLPTLLRNKTILVTNTSAANFTLDGSQLSRPDLYVSYTVAVHGIDAVLDYRKYGSAARPLSPLPPPPAPPLPPPPPPTDPEPEPASGFLVPEGEEMSGACLCDDFAIVFLVLSGALILKILTDESAKQVITYVLRS